MMFRLRLLSFLLMILPAMTAHAAEIIVHATVPMKHISRSTLRAIFAMRMLKWPDGQPISVFVLNDEEPAHAEFCKENLGIYPYQLRDAWDRLVYTGIGQAPQRVTSLEEMKAWIAKTPGAIGYLPTRSGIKPGEAENVRILSER